MTRDEVVQSNLGLVHACAKRFVGRGIEYDDLFQAGCVGLVKAVDGFEPERGLCFSTYAVPLILGEMRHLFREGGAVKVSRSLRSLSLQAGRLREKLLSLHGREPSVEELAAELGIEPALAAQAVCVADEVSIQRVLNNYFEFTRQRCRAHTVHRLDKHTSGLLIFAKDKKISFMFEKNWKDIISDRRYVAVVEGFMEKEYGTVESYLKDNRMFVSYSSDTDDGGKHAITHYKTLKRKPDFSLVELRLETGRKNQIRVHMHDLKHPIVGDEKYGSTSDPIKRVALHAYKLSFTHPMTNEELSFETPIPTNFMQLL